MPRYFELDTPSLTAELNNEMGPRFTKLNKAIATLVSFKLNVSLIVIY